MISNIIFFSFFITQYFESVNPLDSLVMVTNQFTSNGYSISGHTISSKLNSLFLAWGGYLISSVSTAILTTTILTNHFNKKINKIKNDEFFKKSAEESAKSTITALTKPIVDTFDEEYEIVIEWRDNNENN